MKLLLTDEDEAKIYTGHIRAICFFTGDNEAEIKITDCVRPGAGKIEAFAAGAKKKLSKKGIIGLSFIAEGGSEVENCMKRSKKLRLSRIEYMFRMLPDEKRQAEEGAELLLTDVTEDGEEITVVHSAEKDLFTARLRPYNGGMYIYGVEVREDMRHKGYGTKYMKSICYAFRNKPLYLQVGSPNTVACRLYRHTGFETETELCYYVL